MFKFKGKFVTRRGQILPILAIGTAVFLGFAAITIDYGYLAWQRRSLQNAADSGALAAAWELPFGSVEPKAEEFTNGVVSDSYKSASKSTNGMMVTVTAERTYKRMFGNIFKFFDDNAPSSDVISAEATARKSVAELDILPIADIDTYTKPGVANNERDEDTDPFYYYMQDMTLDEYYEFMMLRLRGGTHNGSYEYIRTIGNGNNATTEDVTVNIEVEFEEQTGTDPGPSLAESTGTVTIDNITDGTTESYNIAGNEIVFREATGNIKGNLGLLDLEEFSTGNNIKEVLRFKLNESIYNEDGTGEDIGVKTGKVDAIEKSNEHDLSTRLELDGWRGYVLSVLPSKAAGLTGNSVSLSWNDYLLLYIENFELDITDSDRPLYGDIRGVFHLGKVEKNISESEEDYNKLAYPNMEDEINDMRVQLIK